MEAQVHVPKYKIIRIKKAGGGTRPQKVQVLASGKYKFVKNSTKSRKTTTKRRKSTRKGMVRKTARRAYEKIRKTSRKTNKDSMWNW
jgi:hypothetical protein